MNALADSITEINRKWSLNELFIGALREIWIERTLNLCDDRRSNSISVCLGKSVQELKVFNSWL